MKKAFVVTTAALIATLAAPLLHGQEKQRVSPHETVKATIDGNEVTIVYGRPYSKDPKSGEKRKIWGTLVPFDKAWRLGADEATSLTTQKPLEIGGKTVPAGSYTLFMVPHSETSASLIVNKQTGQWGTKYDEKQDLVRVDMRGAPASSPADQLTIAIDSGASGGGTLKVTWENTTYSVDLKANK